MGECEGMNHHTPKWAPTLRIRILMKSQIFKEWFQRSKPIELENSSYHWRALRMYMSKMGSHGPFGYLKHKLWPKEGPIIKLPISLSITKSFKSPYFLTCRWRATYYWKALDKGYNFALDLTWIEGLHTKLWASKVAGDPILGISGLAFGNPETKWHLGAGPVAKHKEYYKGKVVASPKSGLWWVLWVRVCSWLVRAPKMFQLRTN